MTAYVLTGLQITRQAGHAVRPEVMGNAYRYLFQSIDPEHRRREATPGAISAETDAYIAYVLSWVVPPKGKPKDIGPKDKLDDILEALDSDPSQKHLAQLRLHLSRSETG